SPPLGELFVGRSTPGFAHLRPVRETIFRLCRERGTKPVCKSTRKHSEIGTLTELSRKNCFRIVSTKRRVASQREVHDRREREIICRRTLLLTQQLFRCRERRRSSCPRNILSRHVGNSEISDAPSLIAIDENVLRFQIAVQDSVGVGDDECGENLIDLQRNLRDLTRA